MHGRNWRDGHNPAEDGIPLRVDLHRAYDRGLMQFDDEHRLIAVSPDLRGPYGQYLRRPT
ncbi:hypothetical protein C0Z20_16905 [Trinickia symbiotica]|uniref:HNH endonuclease n=1 Tax=Trinickia symbiotica TaxID=863227 RepID=A0A2N7X1Y3_9BURK|nr:hypothetical protein C0Z20_16905 [Trinickia symbiotica]